MAVSNFGSTAKIMQDLFGNGVITNKEDTTIANLLSAYRQILQNNLRPYADVLPYADSSITEDLNKACNLLVEMEWHRLKYHYEDVKAAKLAYDVVWDSIVTNLKALPTERTKPVSVSGNFANGSILLKNIPNLTDTNGNIVDGF